MIWAFKRAGSSVLRTNGYRLNLSHTGIEVTHLLPADTKEEKLTNLAIGSARVSNVVLAPGDRFSFWLAVGRPGATQGFKPSRSIVDGQLRSEVGGGLCQLAGMIFHLSLLGGLELIERHGHSIDIYREEERFAPLGLDAAVVFPTKDLVLANTGSGALRFAINVVRVPAGYKLIGKLLSETPIESRLIQVQRIEQVGFRNTLVTVTLGASVEREFMTRYQVGC